MTLKDERDAFQSVTKLILKEKLSKKPETLLDYRIKIINAYNRLNRYCHQRYPSASEEGKQTLLLNSDYAKEKFKECLVKLNCKYTLSDEPFQVVNETDVPLPTIEESTESNQETNSSGKSTPSLQDSENSLSSSISGEKQPVTMAQDRAEVLTLCKNVLQTDYKGEPLELESFINKINMLKDLVETVNVPTLFAYVKIKLSGKALEALKPTDNTVERIITSLRERIKPENSDVIKGKMTALRLANKSIQEFAKQAEDLSEAFKRSLVIEGFPENKAHQLTIEKTIDICRESAYSDVVKSVLASSKFTTAQDVISKFITETDKSKTEKQVLAVRQFNAKNKRGFSHSSRGRTNNQPTNRRYWNNPSQNNGNRYQGNRTNNWRGNNRRENNRGRNNQNQYRQSNGYANSSRNNVRAIMAGPENFTAPQQSLGEMNQARQQQQF